MPIAFHLDMELDQLTSWVERMPQAVMLVDDRGGVVAVNHKLQETLRFERDEILGRPCTRFVSLPKDVEEYITQTESMESPVQSVQGNLQVKGVSPPCPTAIQLISGQSRRGWYHLLLFTPVSQQLSIVQQYAEVLLADLHMGVVVFDKQGRVVEINPVACGLLGIRRQQVLGAVVRDLFGEIIPIKSRFTLLEQLTQGLFFRNFSTAWEVNENYVEAVVDYQPIDDASGDRVGTYLMIRDETELHTLEMQLRRTDRLAMIGQIAAGTAHEIRNPLTSIKGFLQVMKHALREKGELKEQGYTEIMLREIDRINDLLSEFLLMSKPRSARMYAVQVVEVLQELLPLIENEAILHNTEVRYEDLGKLLPEVLADGELLKQVFLNLCKNGIEAMGDGGVLTIRLRWLEEECKMGIDIADVGPGIPTYAMDKIFDPFFTTKETGTGLGLSVCQRIVHDIGGTIHVSSGDWGTTFTVLLPGITK
ncbi:PAS domain S-box-containing protein [Marininema mesophilum]|uniref:histidine kinase n=1 Tax=Marininema mesophilum TaxID=1048340 RepID=A0A1H3AAE3_9BACL|nr:ATP-binding protein [Marininema mesophilum]SDX26431.1 PAS domain S-box-containing protein [Marininema mesophilum]